MATAKTNAVRLLDRLGIRYELRPYDVDPDDLAAETVAENIGAAVGRARAVFIGPLMNLYLRWKSNPESITPVNVRFN